VNHAILNVFTLPNITLGFASVEIFPVNPDKFQHIEFVASLITDRFTEKEKKIAETWKEILFQHPVPAANSVYPILNIEVTVFCSKMCVPFQKLDLQTLKSRKTNKKERLSCETLLKNEP
jgi:hypothetical protein